MARFTIYSPTGTALYTGTPIFTGQYMKPGLLEFREVALPALVDIVPGCYVDYTRTGHRYRIYTVPQLKKQARTNSYGAAFVYQSVQLYDASKMLEYCPFRDLVLGDNRIHFSTQPSISTFEGCDGLARRFEACLQDQYGANSWVVRTATRTENPNLYDLMMEPREFTVSGLNILECLNKVYEIWPEVGWIYKVENGKDTIVIGGSGLNPNEETYAYGKGFGLTSLTRVAANAEEIANRIFAYGSSRNMLPRWYNSQDIKDAESVDIQNLMLPVEPIVEMDWDGWGETDWERDAAKAYVEDTASITKNGLRPATVYFDGKGEYPEIYPSIRETTIAMVRHALGDSTAKYYPSTAIYTDSNARVDKLLSAQSLFDSGLAGENGKSSVDSKYQDISENESVDFPSGWTQMPVYTYEGTYTPSQSGEFALSLGLNVSGYVSLSGIKALKILGIVSNTDTETDLIFDAKSIPVVPGENIITIPNLTFEAKKVQLDSSVQYFVGFLFTAEVEAPTQTDRTCTVDFSGGYSLSLSNYRSKTFNISLRQLGFDINEQSALGNGKTIAMRSGDCVGRSFAIKSAQYNAANDCWDLECWRTEDESLSQWFPNTDYPVEAEDEFALLDIAMPDIYVSMAEQKLLTAARDLLADSAVERWQYMPEIDAKFMVENGATLRAGEWMALLDIDAEDITPTTITYFRVAGGGYFFTTNNDKTILSIDPGSVITAFVDTVTINEGESVIPTYKITLRDRKKKTWTESQSPDSSSSKSVGNITTETTQTTAPTVVGDSFFELDGDGNVTLKSQYQNLWVPGWLAAGGVGEGGGGVSYLRELTDVYHGSNGVLRADGTPAQPGDSLVYNATYGWLAAPVSGGGGGGTDLQTVWNSLTNAVQDEFASTKIHIDHIPLTDLDTWLSGKNIGTVTSVTIKAGTGISVSSSAAITTSGERTISISSTYSTYITHGESAYNSLSNYATKTELESLSGRVTTLENESFFMLDGSGNVTLKANYSNLWVPGWLAAGGSGSGSSSGGTDLNRVWDSLTNNTDKPNVKINIAHIPDITTAKITDLNTWIAGKGYLTSESDPTVPAWAKASNKPSYSLSEISGTDDIQAIEALTGTSGLLRKTGTNTWSLDTTAYLPLTGGTMTGNIVMNWASIVPSANNTSGLGTSSARFAGIYGVNANLSGDLSLSSSSHIDIGPVRIVYDSASDAIHITTNDATNHPTIGIYADGFVAAGGVGQTS